MRILNTIGGIMLGVILFSILFVVIVVFTTGMLRVREVAGEPQTLCIEIQSQSYCTKVSERVVEALHSFGERHTE